MKKKIFATRVSTSEFFALLKKATNNNQDIKEEQQEFLRTGTRYYRDTIPEPNLAIGKYTYELTDDAIVYHWPFECDGEGEYGYQKNAGSSPFAFRTLRSFYLKIWTGIFRLFTWKGCSNIKRRISTNIKKI